MQRQSVQSSNIHSVGYDENLQILEIVFKSSGIYEYYGVPKNVYRGLIEAPSKGKFLNEHIKGKYGYEKQ